MTVVRMGIQWWPKKSFNNTFSVCNIFYFIEQQWLFDHASLLRYTYKICLWLIMYFVGSNLCKGPIALS
jgi:hypothetical protein